MQNIALLGATGSIGASALDVISRFPERYRVHAIAAGKNFKRLAQLASVWRPSVVAIADEASYKPLLQELANAGVVTRVEVGNKAIAELAAEPEVDTVIGAVVGAVGLMSSFSAAKAGKRLLLANKESVVCGGELLMRTAQENRSMVLPVDSEHNAVFQCLEGANPVARNEAKIWLTCSGGPFYAKKDLDLSTVTPAQALAHPTWNMGKKISIDSATLMNKGLEVIEAHHLFSKSVDDIGVVIHPQSIVHSMVEFADGAVLAQLGCPNMCMPINYCLGYPERMDADIGRLDLTKAMNLRFEPPDTKRFPQLALAYDAVREGGIATIVLNAANEVGVNAFLEEKIGFTDIAVLCAEMLGRITGDTPQCVEEVFAADKLARTQAAHWVKQKAGK